MYLLIWDIEVSYFSCNAHFKNIRSSYIRSQYAFFDFCSVIPITLKTKWPGWETKVHMLTKSKTPRFTYLDLVRVCRIKLQVVLKLENNQCDFNIRSHSQTLNSEIRHIWSLHIFKNVRSSPKCRANSRMKSDILAPSQFLILLFEHGWNKTWIRCGSASFRALMMLKSPKKLRIIPVKVVC